MAKRKKQEWKVGDVFLVPLCDGTYTVGQILSYEPEALDSVICAYSTQNVERSQQGVDIDPEQVVAVLFTTPNHLNSGNWPVVNSLIPLPVRKFLNLKKKRWRGFVGTKVVGSRIIKNFMEACLGLYPWNGFYEPDYLDGLLLSPDKKPNNVVYESKE